jgi:hypothetical protein
MPIAHPTDSRLYLKALLTLVGHAKNDGRLGRNYLLGTAGDKINTLLAAAGHNLRLVLSRLALLLARILGAVADFLAAITGIPAANNRHADRYNGPGRINGYLTDIDKFAFSIS